MIQKAERTTIAELRPLPQGPRYADRKKKNTHLEEQFW